jgi:hypothetical protein
MSDRITEEKVLAHLGYNHPEEIFAINISRYRGNTCDPNLLSGICLTKAGITEVNTATEQRENGSDTARAIMGSVWGMKFKEGDSNFKNLSDFIEENPKLFDPNASDSVFGYWKSEKNFTQTDKYNFPVIELNPPIFNILASLRVKYRNLINKK